jgi:cobalt-zinc-cadmium efflux system protein
VPPQAVSMEQEHPHRQAQKRALTASLVANAIFLFVEVAAGVAFGSLALLADAAHMLSDVVALSVALIAQRLLEIPASSRHTYGLQRAEVLAAQFNGLGLVVAAAWIVFEALARLDRPPAVSGGGLALVASVGLLVNLWSARLLYAARAGSLNMRAAFLHMVLDSLGSVGALLAGLAVVLWDARVADPIVSFGIAGLVLWSAWGLLRDTTHVLLEGAPRGMDSAEVSRALASDPAVEAVHHLHLWNLASDVPALSAHVVLVRGSSLHDAQLQGQRLKEMLRTRFGIEHSTLELECHVCDPVHEHAH